MAATLATTQREQEQFHYLLNDLQQNNMPYLPSVERTVEDDKALTWNAKLFESAKRTHCNAERFEAIFKETMTYITTTEHHMYMDIQKGLTTEREFVAWLRSYFNRTYPEMRNDNDFSIMYERLHTAVFQYYVLQPLIDHDDTSDIKVCAPDDIRVRVKGKAYRSTCNFLSVNDLYQFIEGLALRNGLDFSHPEITFTDTHDKHYILRFLISAPAVNAVDYPYLHIRKVPRDKPDFDKLVQDEMLTDMVVDYLKDRIKTSKGIVFSGPPGCVDRETEFFNGREWKSIADYRSGEQVLQFDTATGIASMVTPSRYIKEPCSMMYHFETKYGINQTLSPEHRVIYYDEDGSVQEMSAEELCGKVKAGTFAGKIRTTFRYTTDSPHIENGTPLDGMQFVFSSKGTRSVLKMTKDGYSIMNYRDAYIGFENAVVSEVKPKDGYKYCFTVPTHALVLRRKGNIFITGNSGKTTLLNAGLEVIPKTRETLVIQENDELHTNQSGFMFKHVTHGFHGEPVITLEELGKMALVEGCNEFVIGEVKGGEMRYAATLMRSGGYCMYTTHSLSARETLPRCADLVKQGSDYSFEDACKMLKNVETVVFMEDYQVQEILEVKGFDVKTQEFIYRPIYLNPHPRYAKAIAADSEDEERKQDGVFIYPQDGKKIHPSSPSSSPSLNHLQDDSAIPDFSDVLNSDVLN